MTTIASSTSALTALLHAPLEAPPALDSLWMPFTNNRAFKQAPRILVSAKDMHYTDADGRQVLDGVAGLWCVNAGHCRAPIAEAIATAARTLDYAPPFQMGHSLAFALAERVALAADEEDRIGVRERGDREGAKRRVRGAVASHVFPHWIA